MNPIIFLALATVVAGQTQTFTTVQRTVETRPYEIQVERKTVVQPQKLNIVVEGNTGSHTHTTAGTDSNLNIEFHRQTGENFGGNTGGANLNIDVNGRYGQNGGYTGNNGNGGFNIDVNGKYGNGGFTGNNGGNGGFNIDVNGKYGNGGSTGNNGGNGGFNIDVNGGRGNNGAIDTEWQGGGQTGGLGGQENTNTAVETDQGNCIKLNARCNGVAAINPLAKAQCCAGLHCEFGLFQGILWPTFSCTTLAHKLGMA